MKIIKVLLIGIVLIFAFSLNPVYANSGPPITGINIMPEQCTESFEDNEFIPDFEGNFDIIVKKSDFEASEFSELTEQYKTFYPFYAEIDYLQDLEEGWTSFSAYYNEEESWGYADYLCGMQFGDTTTVAQLSSIKVIYFDDEGTTLFLSEEINIPSVYFFQEIDAIIHFNTETLEILPSLDPYTYPYLVFAIILILGFVLFSIIIELVVAFVLQLKTKKAILNILLINFITQGLMYIYFLVIFDAYKSQYFLHLYIFEGLILIIEFLYLHWRLKPVYSWKHIALFVLYRMLYLTYLEF
jgi:hypothetical protein